MRCMFGRFAVRIREDGRKTGRFGKEVPGYFAARDDGAGCAWTTVFRRSESKRAKQKGEEASLIGLFSILIRAGVRGPAPRFVE